MGVTVPVRLVAVLLATVCGGVGWEANFKIEN